MLKFLQSFVQFTMILVELLLVSRFLLNLFAVNSSLSPIFWVLTNTEPLLKPFLYIFPTPKISGSSVLEFTTLFAIFSYAFIGYFIQLVLKVIVKKK